MDVSKAYGTCSLEGRVVDENEEVWCRRVVSLCEGLYSEVEAGVLVNGQQSRWFEVEEGLRQSCPLSSLLYSTYLWYGNG